MTFEMPSRQVFLYELVGPETMANAIALNSGLFNASRILGPALAGVLLKWVGETMCFSLNGVSYLAAIAALYSIPAKSRSAGGSIVGSGQAFGGFRYLRKDRRVATIYLLMTVFGIAGMGYSALAPSYARRLVGTDAGGYSFLLAMSGVGATAGALGVAALGSVRRRDRLVLGGIAIFSASLAAAALLPPAIPTGLLGGYPRLIAAGLCLTGVGMGAVVFYSSCQAIIHHAVPDDLRGRIMGVWMVVYSGSVPLGCLWAGELALAAGAGPVMLASSILCGASAATVGALKLLKEREPVAARHEINAPRRV